MRRLHPHAREAGFTLIELLVTLAVFAILAAIAVPIYATQRTAQIVSSVRADTHNLATAVRTATLANPNATGFQLYTAATAPTVADGVLPVRNVAQGQNKFKIVGPVACNENPLAATSSGTTAGYSVVGYNDSVSGYAYWFNSVTGLYYDTDSYSAATGACTPDNTYQSK